MLLSQKKFLKDVFVVLIAVGIKFVLLVSSQRWYYTGNFQNDVESHDFFDGKMVDHQVLYDYNVNDKNGNVTAQILYCGGLILTPLNVEGQELLEQKEIDFLRNITLSAHHDPIVNRYTINVAKNYARPIEERFEDGTISRKASWPILNAEVGLYDAKRGIFVQREWKSLNLGTLIASTFKDASNITHKVMWTTDMHGRLSLVQHMWDSPLYDNNVGISYEADGSVTNFETQISPFNLRVMTYNLWHNNPPSWIYGDKRQRWKRYYKRMKHFAETILSSKPDIVTLQEVRLDGSFYSVDNFMPYWRNDSEFKVDGGSQIEHILHHLASAKKRLNLSDDFDYQVIYQPAMSMWDKASLAMRNEEGLLILSRYPIVGTKAVLLPRDTGNTLDDHQRILLAAQIYVRGVNVTVGTSHWSLHEHSRDITADRILDILKDDVFSTSSLHIITGDFNAEPHEKAIEKLLSSSKLKEDGFVDAWPHLNKSEGLTFPTCNPIKRIDFILLRNNSHSQCKSAAILSNVFIVGQDPTSETIHLVNSREGLGMNDEDSPIWASDHLGVVADINVVSILENFGEL